MMQTEVTNETDYLLAGGGLQNGLLALFLLDRDPDARLTLLEQGPTLGGNHTWSFHASDVPASCKDALSAIPQYAWDHYDVIFPTARRTVKSGYRSIIANEFHDALVRRFAEAPHATLRLNTSILGLTEDSVTLDNGEVLHGRHVIDSRGLSRHTTPFDGGYQKFVGLELQLDRPAGFHAPVLMDARVSQHDGFRFFYVLPFSSDRVLIEDTRFSDTPDLDVGAMQSGVLAYAQEHGCHVREIIRSESGVLPMPSSMNISPSSSMPLRGGYRGGFMHPATGYSFPLCLKLACFIADRAPNSPFGPAWDAFVRSHSEQYRFTTFLNRLLFTAYPPESRYHIFQHFYRMPVEAIERFYRLELKAQDKARIFLGQPPRGISIRRLLEGASAL